MRLIEIADKVKDTSHFVRGTAERVFDILAQYRELLSFLKKQDVVVEAVVEKQQEKVVEKPKAKATKSSIEKLANLVEGALEPKFVKKLKRKKPEVVEKKKEKVVRKTKKSKRKTEAKG